MSDATSVTREQRVSELIEHAAGPITAQRAAEFLRDRRLPGGAFAGNGHRSTLNAFIATHATVMDLTAGIFWAASTPHQLGRFVAFDVNDFSNELPERGIPPDETLVSGEFEKTKQALKCLADGHRALHLNDPKTAFESAQKAESLNPGYYENAVLRGRAEMALNRQTEAARSFEAALAGHPAFLKEERELKKLLEEARNWSADNHNACCN